MEARERQENQLDYHQEDDRGVLRLSPDQALDDIFRLSLRHSTSCASISRRKDSDSSFQNQHHQQQDAEDEDDASALVIVPEEDNHQVGFPTGLRKRGSVAGPTAISPTSSCNDTPGSASPEQRQSPPTHVDHRTIVPSTLPRPVRKRTKSWSSEGEVHHIVDDDEDEDSVMMRMLYNHAAAEVNHQDAAFEEEEEEDLLQNSSFEFLLRPPPRLSARRKLTPAALALSHGSLLQKPTAKAALQEVTARPASSNSETIRAASPANNMKQQQSPQLRKPTRWLIPVNHPIKILWDMLTVVLSIYNVYCTHAAIRDRQFQTRPGFIEAWFLIDILLNFCTQRTAGSGVLNTWQQVWGKYLTSWFVVDVLALFPGEVLYIQPLIEMQRKRKLHQKILRRTKVAVKVTTRILKNGHVPWVYKAIAKASARPIREIVKIIKVCVKYIPKYVLFVRNMKGWILVRLLRDVGHFRMAWRHTKVDAATVDLTEEDAAAHEQETWEGLKEESDDDDSFDDVGPY